MDRRAALALFATAGTAAVAGCAPRPDGTPPPTPGPTPAGTTAPTPTPTPTRTPTTTPTPTPAGPPTVGEPTDVVTGLTSPWGLALLADATMLVSERDTGLIKRVSDGRATEVVEVEDVEPSSEGGLLGIAVSPDETALYAYHTTGRDNRITRFAWDGEAATAPEVILDGIPYAARHDGGRLAFGPDGLLYVSTGDAAERRLAQEQSSLAGKILRLTPDGAPAPDNPFDNEVFSYGHRNVQGLAFDDGDRLWASEFGNQTQDELNLIRAGGNYGWPAIEGDESTIEGMTNPVHTWSTDEASPSGLAYTRGSLWMAALRGSRLWEIPLDDGKAGEPRDHFAGTYGRLRTVVAAPDGSHLLLVTSNTDGRATPKSGDDRVLRVPLG
ncbi:PQQ-dependent sugar dehydrogenase [Propionibacteriaceae bacterium Y2011]